ncbi:MULTISPECIES: hypothetical protein [unclassified Polaribacter]|uniref:hypothetical protein n=1 Tax=unclassified Polaribacter TaxID=196858 RepID=UPI0011BF5620|nr:MULTISPECIES: hypothetical protein [unclassified Polaribacter]TXD53484.1 hypothetical protein ES043_03600 [Polaribacter sp. IC063]TXD57723.1 hypothetical protein ES044_14325 [Polaribacter sp. IC066]
MEHNIRDLFVKNEENKKELPKNHREEFLEKLNTQTSKKKKIRFFFFLKIASSILFTICCTYFYFGTTSDVQKKSKTQAQIQMEIFEKEYLTNIDKEWNSFMKIATDTVLIKRYKKKLKESDLNYQKLVKNFKEHPNNSNVLESLIQNLQQRLELIKGIEAHIKELNQKNTSNETIYL